MLSGAYKVGIHLCAIPSIQPWIEAAATWCRSKVTSAILTISECSIMPEQDAQCSRGDRARPAGPAGQSWCKIK